MPHIIRQYTASKSVSDLLRLSGGLFTEVWNTPRVVGVIDVYHFLKIQVFHTCFREMMYESNSTSVSWLFAICNAVVTATFCLGTIPFLYLNVTFKALSAKKG